MAGTIVGIVGLVLAAAAAVLLVVVWRGGLAGATRRVIRLFWCPVPERNVAAEFEEVVWDGRRLAVLRCSAFRPPTALGGCGMDCLTVKRLAALKSGSEAAQEPRRLPLESA